MTNERRKELYSNMLNHISELVSGIDLVDTLHCIGFTTAEIVKELDICVDAEPTLKVCEHCLMAIESREGKKITRTIDVAFADDETELKCDWCEETEIDRLFELL